MMTKQQAIEEHRKMWNWIADNTLELGVKVPKSLYFKANLYPAFDIPKNLCFCCEYAYEVEYEGLSCHICPIQWENDFCLCCGSAFFKWSNEMNYKKAAKLARKIANLPEREDN